MSVLLRATCFSQEALEIRLRGQSDGFEQNRQAALDSAKAKGVIQQRVAYVKVEGRWANKVKIPLAAGDVITTKNISAAMGALREAITNSSNSDYALQSKGEVGVLYIAAEYDTGQISAVPRGTAGVIFRPYYINISLVQIGNNVLPIPRSALATFYENVPKPLLALKPVVAVFYDRAFGTALSAAFEGDLLSLTNFERSNDAAEGPSRLEIRGEGTKSVEQNFYRADGGLRYSVRHDAGPLQELSLYTDFDGVKEPYGDGEHRRTAGVGTLGLKLKFAPNTRLWLNAGYRRTDDEVNNTMLTSKSSANEQTGRLLLDAIPPSINGFVRAAIWEESGWQSNSGNSYQRLVGRVGYEKEIPVAPNQSVGIEIIAGGGKAFGHDPGYTRFFGGNAAGQYLYDSPTGDSLLKMPSGPLIRSFGENEAGLRDSRGRAVGGDAFWHVNLNVTFPIPSLSRSLIPNEVTDLKDSKENLVSVKQLLGRQIDVSGPNMLAATLQEQGMSDQEATERANEILQEVTPAAHYIINEANLYSLKPILMFDAAGMSDHGGANETWLAAGGGIQLTVVTAKLEVGYMQTLTGPTFGSRGSLFARLVFQNLF
ncbi:MAG: outer membrane protein assembly factor [Verrucomicrobiota bacterium]|nr:outer membrane protein assembly factor [Verrucomicrobiota bacterium]